MKRVLNTPVQPNIGPPKSSENYLFCSIPKNTKNGPFDTPGGIFLNIIKRVALQSSQIGMLNSVGMESSFNSGWNGMKSFHSAWNEMAIPFRTEWKVHSISDRMESSFHSGHNGMESFHSDNNINNNNNNKLGLSRILNWLR